MKQVVIENPVINSPFDEPKRHFKFTDEGITNEIVGKRRVSSYFIPIAKPKKRGKQLILDTEWTQDRVEVSGEARKEKAAKVATTRALWVEAVNNHGGFGRWEFIEISDPWDARNTILAGQGSR
jgi:hypothetical protein